MFNIRTSYDYYTKAVEAPMPEEVYRQVAEAYSEFLLDKVIDEGEEVALPGRMGTLVVMGKKQKPKVLEDGTITGMAPDWKATKALWEKSPEAKANKKLVYHTNADTGGVRYKLHWSKRKVFIPYKTQMSFRLTKQNKIRLNKAIESGTEYRTH